MKRVLLSLALVAAMSPAAMSNPSPASSGSPVKAAHKVAPADEYFGRMKMSILSIRNAIKDLGLKAEAHPENAESIFGTASLTEDAIRDWEQKYPLDTWLAKTVFSLQRMYAKVPTDEGRARARKAQQWVVARYGTTEFAATVRAEITAGSTAAAPAIAPSTTVATAPVTPVAAPVASATEAVLPGEVVLPDSSGSTK